MKGLLVKQPWIDKILSGKKTWELRGSATRNLGKIALLESGSGLVVGTCDLVAVHRTSTHKVR
ncbi:MAG: ASCH domain-containing protein [Planctomycetota bacterium]|nr:ASCH domain-containing protein [Planctomycetota bacterium]